MTQQEKDKRLAELNAKCIGCREKSMKEGFRPPNPQSCLSETGREIHKLENPEWDAQNWTSSKLEGLYGN